jgi:hypothetical protein
MTPVGKTIWSSAFHIRTTPHSIKIDCYGTEGKTMDALKHNGRIQMSAL